MDYSKTIIASLLLQVFFTQAEGSCTRQGMTVTCTDDISNFASSELARLEKESPSLTELTLLKCASLEKLQTVSSTAAYKALWLLYNENLTTINPSFFASSTHSATKLNIWDSPKLGNGVWDLVSKMSVLENLVLNGIGLTDVPTNAFNTLSPLRELSLSHNRITLFQASLKGLELESLDLADNNLSNETFSDCVFQGVGSIKQVFLGRNKEMTQLREAQFKGLLNAGTKVHVGGGDIFSGKYMRCMGAEWLCVEKKGGAYKYAEQVIGYECGDPDFPSGTIFDYCSSRN